MPAVRPIKQKELIRFLRKLDFIGPYSGGKHQFMVNTDFHASFNRHIDIRFSA